MVQRTAGLKYRRLQHRHPDTEWLAPVLITSAILVDISLALSRTVQFLRRNIGASMLEYELLVVGVLARPGTQTADFNLPLLVQEHISGAHVADLGAHLAEYIRSW